MSGGKARIRTIGAQVDRMARLWPSFQTRHFGEGVRWRGRLRPLQLPYLIDVQFAPETLDRPMVRLIDPPLAPRPGTSFENMHHLMFWEERPELSAMCLFDPNGDRWEPTMWIADTTMLWAARWLYFYEFWHFDGNWRGGGVGPSTVAEARVTAIHESSGGLAQNAASEASLAR